MLLAMTRMARLTQAIGVVLLGLALLAAAIQVIGGEMWRELADTFVRLTVS